MTSQKEGHSKQRKEQIKMSEELGVGPVQVEDDGYEREVYDTRMRRQLKVGWTNRT